MRKSHTITLILFAILSILTSSEAQMNMGSSTPFQAPFTHRPMFAQFLNSDYILKGNESGLSLLDIGKNQVTENHLEGVPSYCDDFESPHDRTGHCRVLKRVMSTFVIWLATI